MMMRYVRGVSMVEFLVAITLSIVVSTGLVTLLSANKTTYTIQDNLARIQESGRYLRYMLGLDIRMAGFMGCDDMVSHAPINLINNPSQAQEFSLDTAVHGYEATDDANPVWSPALPAWITDNIAGGTALVNGSDILVIRQIAPNLTPVTVNMATNSDNVSVANRFAIAPGDILIVTDCEDTDIIKASTGTSNTVINHTTADNTTSQLSKAFQIDARVGHLRTYIYYVKDTGRTNMNGQTIRALYRQDINGNEAELIPGVERLQVRYGLDTTGNGSADTFATAETINNNNQWGLVISIRVSALIATVEEVNPKIQSYTYQGQNVTPTDRRLYREWDNYFTLRNRTIGL